MANILDANIPLYWKELNGWSRSFSNTSNLKDKNAKRPLIAPSQAGAELAPSLVSLLMEEQPENPIGYCGFISSTKNDIVIIDIDVDNDVKLLLDNRRDDKIQWLQLHQQLVIDPLPPAIKNLIKTTYCEYSASGAGIHVVLRTDKSALGTDKAYLKASEFKGQLSIKNNYMVTTGNILAESSRDIMVVDAAELLVLFSNGKNDATDVLRDLSNIDNAVPSLAEIEQALLAIPIDQSPRLKEVYKQEFKQEYEHYHFWLTIGMALHDFATRTNQLSSGLAMYIKWSALDKECFTSDEDVAAKWESFKNKKGITFRTIFKLAAAFQFNYPRRIKKDGVALLSPEKTEYVNFKYLIDKYNLKLHSASGIEVYLTGDDDIIQKYFMLHGVNSMFGYYGPYDIPALQAATWRLCQDSLWRGLTNTSQFVQAWVLEPMKEVDMFDKWLDTEDNLLSDEFKYPRFFKGSKRRENKPEYNTFEYLESCITWADDQNVELCRQMLYKLFMQVIKLHDEDLNVFEDNGGMFALIGPENSYKTTFFKLLLPHPLEFMRKDINQELSNEKNKRDFVRYLSTRAFVLVDEFEGFMDQKKSGSFFKSIISSNTTSFTDIYQTKERALVRKAVLVGTSNDTRQIISDNGSRRLWFTKIETINTSAMLNINLHAFYRNMKARFKEELARGRTPWLLSFDQTKEVTRQNMGLKAHSSLDIALREVFPYNTTYSIERNRRDVDRLIPNVSLTAIAPSSDENFTKTRCKKTQQVMKALQFCGFTGISAAELERALERYCKEFIGQFSQRPLVLKLKPETVIQNGRLLMYKRTSGIWNHKYWILPIEEDLDENL